MKAEDDPLKIDYSVPVNVPCKMGRFGLQDEVKGDVNTFLRV